MTKKQRWATVTFLGFVFGAGGFGMVACSSDSGTGGPTGGGGRDATVDGNGGGDDGGGGSDSTTGDGGGGGDAGVDCGRSPSLRPNADAGIFCPFQNLPDGSSPYCGIGDHCCTYKADASVQNTCKTIGNAPADQCDPQVDAGGADFECGEPSDCKQTGSICCLRGTPSQDPTCIDPAKHMFGRFVKGTYCTTSGSCQANEYVVCSKQGDCTTGTCTPFSVKTIDLGACIQ